MSSLIVLLPPLLTFDDEVRRAVPLSYAIVDRKGDAAIGYAGLDELPKADATLLVVSAIDTLLVDVELPPVKGPRLRRLLPNVVEEFLIDDAQHGHIAVGTAGTGSVQRTVAVVERERFGTVVRRFSDAGHRRLRAVSLIHCMPAASGVPSRDGPARDELPDAANADVAPGETAAEHEASEADVLIVRRAAQPGNPADDATSMSSHEAHSPWLELAVRSGAGGFGFEVPAASLDATIAELAKWQSLRIHALAAGATRQETSGHDGGNASHHPERHAARGAGHEIPDVSASAHTAFPLAAQTFSWETLARNALACPFDLCQFEFESAARGRAGNGGLKPWRMALGLIAASVVVSIAAVNIQWLQVRHRRDALNEQMLQIVKTAFPGTPVILEPHTQMQIGLARLRSAAGELRPDDYLVLAAGLSHALGPIPSDALTTLDYSEGSLGVTFKPASAIDGEAFRHRVEAQGLRIQEDNGKWTIGSARPAPH